MTATAGWIALEAVDDDAFAARAFATDPADVEAWIDPALPAESIDALLTRCLVDANGRSPTLATVRAWTVARRLDALIAIRQAGGDGIERIAVRCGAADCGESFEVDVDLAACRGGAAVAGVDVDVAGERLHVRLPTGADQSRWARERTPLRLVAANLVGRVSAVDEGVVAAVDAALAAADPAREPLLEFACPGCGTVARHPLRLEAELVSAFARLQRRWLEQIARLAAAYHWSEAEIARLPAWRRAFYLGRIDAGPNAEVAR